MLRASALIAVLIGLAATPGVASARDLSTRPPLAVKVSACTTGADPAQRAATFTASMPALQGTDHMAMRFELLQRRGSATKYTVVKHVRGWGRWNRSQSGRPGLILTKRVGALLAPAAYRARVTMRWYRPDGSVQRTRTRTTDACTQPDPRADLQVELFSAKPRSATEADYIVVVANTGLATAPLFGVELDVPGAAPITGSVGPLADGTRERLVLTGARCAAGDTVTIRLDPADVIDKAADSDVIDRRPCPLA